VNGLTPAATPASLRWTMSRAPVSRIIRSRCAYIAWNFQVVSTCSSGNGSGRGVKGLRARCSSTDESFPMEYISTGRSAAATASRRISMLSDSRTSSAINPS
jgi:hypothetical protein